MRPIPSTGGLYLAAEDGTIWRARGAMAPTRLTARPLGGAAHGTYLAVTTTVRGVSATRLVHRLVAEAWLPGFHRLLEVHHVNGDPLDNRPENLACLTRAEHELAHGKAVRGCDVANCRLDFEVRRDEPAPSPYLRPGRKAAKGGSMRKWRAAARSSPGKAAAGSLRRLADRAARLVERAGEGA